MVRDRGGTLQPRFSPEVGPDVLTAPWNVNWDDFTETKREQSVTESEFSNRERGISHTFFYRVRCKSMIPLKLCLSDMACCGQNIEPHRLTCKIFRNKELGGDTL